MAKYDSLAGPQRPVDTPTQEQLNKTARAVADSKRSRPSASNGHVSYGRYARGGFSLLKLVAVVLLVFIVFNAVFIGPSSASDSWSFERVLRVLQEAPDVSSEINDLFRKSVDIVNNGLNNLPSYLDFLRVFLSPAVTIVSLLEFFVVGAYQAFRFVDYFVRILLT